MKKIFLLVLFCYSSTFVCAQQDAQFSQNMFNKLASNPGFAGSNQAVSLIGLFRSQWTGFEGAPQTTNISGHLPVSALNGGLGLSIISDQIAQFENTSVSLSYAYRTQVGSGQLGLGLNFGIIQSGLDGSSLNSASGSDPAIPTESISGSALDLGFGVYYNTQDAYFGLSTSHINNPSIERSDNTSYELSQHYFLITGLYHEISSTLSLNPSIYLKSDGTTSQLDINTNLIYNNKLWGGVSYRLDEGLVILTGAEIMEDLKMGLAYDLVFSDINKNSVEVMLGYNFKIQVENQLKKYKNPRFL